MNPKALALATFIGLATPAIADIALTPPVMAQVPVPTGYFQDRTWAVSVGFDGQSFSYYGRNKQTGDAIELYGDRVTGTPQRRVYIWNNNGYIYQVAWRPSDPDLIRVQVFNPNGREILNRLLNRNWDI
ncbi:hypothetical protein IQ249_00740 [Lusitaniella coriacea LEGE 07157]|uniref:Uncharacterized protein n=1 Tax=Lusitaniella coriacea LEGE 07157 TaxID=945747 RepID=A0A8J7DSN0_9CYAN|nr:hypothetical protein [Lusitaniella coriacea]MBE9114412.1 hypothetical protein [Lusitaniella coriacea LEGE 07157]